MPTQQRGVPDPRAHGQGCVTLPARWARAAHRLHESLEGNTAALELERAGLAPGRRGLIEVNERFQTAVAHIYAAGDVIGFPSLAATSQMAFQRSSESALTFEPFMKAIFSCPSSTRCDRANSAAWR